MIHQKCRTLTQKGTGKQTSYLQLAGGGGGGGSRSFPRANHELGKTKQRTGRGPEHRMEQGPRAVKPTLPRFPCFPASYHLSGISANNCLLLGDHFPGGKAS